MTTRPASLALRCWALAVSLTAPLTGLALIGRAARTPASSGVWAELDGSAGARQRAVDAAVGHALIVCLLAGLVVFVLLAVDVVSTLHLDRRARRAAVEVPSRFDLVAPEHNWEWYAAGMHKASGAA